VRRLPRGRGQRVLILLHVGDALVGQRSAGVRVLTPVSAAVT
jgi:hypothetical protein